MSSNIESETFRFLLVDDSRAIQSILRRALESCGYPNLEIRVAGDGEIAMEILEDFKPDLIITDWHMPKMSGLEFCQAVMQVFGKDTPIGFVTTEGGEEEISEARRNGALFVINKPFLDEDFRAVILGVVPKERVKKPEVVEDNMIVDYKPFNEALGEYIVDHQFTLTPCEPITLNDLTENNLIGLYGFSRKPHPVAGIAVMDMNTVGILWGLSANKNGIEIQKAIANNALKDEHMTAARAFMEDIGATVKMPAGKEQIALTRASIFNRTFQRLEMVLKTNSGRADFKLKVPNIGEGSIALILV